MKLCTRIGIVLALLWSLMGLAQTPAGAGDASAQHEFKNVVVLKDIPADQLIPSMQFISASLGVECGYCHVQGAFEKDDKKSKITARKMMHMMFEINANTFDNERKVTCYTCHRGTYKPLSVPPVAISEGPNTTGFSTTNDKSEALFSPLPSTDEILTKYAKSIASSAGSGGSSTYVAKGVATLPGGTRVGVEILSKAPNKRLLVLHLANGESVSAFNGHEGWLRFPGRPVLRMSKSEAEGAKLDAYLQFPADLKQLFSELKVSKEVSLSQQDAYLVLASNPGRPAVEFYFGLQSGLLLRMVRYTDCALGLIPTQIDYDDYRDAGNLKIPYSWISARPEGRLAIQVEKVDRDIPIGDDKFATPKEANTVILDNSR